MNSTVKKVVGATALGALSIVEMLHLQQASATPVTFTGSTNPNPHGGSVQVAITVDGASGTYRITGVSTPVQPGGGNASYANFAIPTLTSEALAAQSAAITGVSGASQISAAWISSLASAIAAAAAGGSPVGQASVTVAPTPTPGSTTPPAGGSTGGTTTPGTAVTPTTSIPTSVATPPVFNPVYVPPYTGGSSGSTSGYLSAVQSAIASLSQVTADRGGNSLNAARSVLASLQAQLQADANGSGSGSAGFSAYVANGNAAMQFFLGEANKNISAYYAKVAAAADQLYADAQAKAAAIKAQPAPTVTVTVAPTPTTPAVVYKPGGVIKKSFICAKTVAGKTTKKVYKGVIAKCPMGSVLVKK